MSANNEERKALERIKLAIAKVVRFQRNITLSFTLESLYNFRLWQENHRWRNRLLFISLNLFFAFGVGNCLKIYLAMLDGTFLDWQNAGIFKYLYHSFGLLISRDSSSLVLAVIIMIPQNFNIIDYTFYPFLHHYQAELADMNTVAKWRYDGNMTKQIGRQISLSFGRHMTVSEKIAFVDVLHRRFAPFYSFQMRFSMLFMIVFFLPAPYYFAFLLPYDIESLDMIAFVYIFNGYITSLVVGILGSVCMPTFLIYFAAILVYGAIFSWRRFCATIRQIDARWCVTNTGINYDEKFTALYLHIRHGQRAYVNCLRVFQKVNHCMLDMVFYVSASLVLVSQVEMLIELFANRLIATVQNLMISLMILEFLFIFLPVFALLMISKQLYSVNKLLLSYQTMFSEHRFQDRLRGFKTRAMLRWSLFGEIIHSRKRFLFCVSLGIGRINSMTIVKFVPIYTSFLFMLIPKVIQS